MIILIHTYEPNNYFALSLLARSLVRSFCFRLVSFFRLMLSQPINQPNEPTKQTINQSINQSTNQPPTKSINQSNNYARYLDNQFTLPSTGELFAGRGTANR